MNPHSYPPHAPQPRPTPAPCRRRRGEGGLLKFVAITGTAVLSIVAYQRADWPGIRAGVGHVLGMRLDPNEVDDIEDRRHPDHGGQPGGDLSQLGPPPGWRPMGRPMGRAPYPPYPGPSDTADAGPQGQAPYPPYPGPETTGAGPQGQHPPRWRYCNAPQGTPNRKCGPWQEGPDPGDEGPGWPPPGQQARRR